MRHGKSFNHLGRKAPHRQAMLSNMASSLIVNRRITTTVAKAKALRQYVEPLITKAKNDTTHSRRVVFSYLQDKESVQALFNEVAAKVADRPGGYTRIVKLADTRIGDNADMCVMELVDYNDLLLTETSEKKKTRRSRRGGGKGKSTEGEQQTTAKKEAKKEETAEKKEKKVDEKAETPETKQEAKAAAKAPAEAEASEAPKEPENKEEQSEAKDESSEDKKEDKE